MRCTGKAVAPLFEQLAGKYGSVRFLKIDIDNEALADVVAEHGITGVVRLLEHHMLPQQLLPLPLCLLLLCLEHPLSHLSHSSSVMVRTWRRCPTPRPALTDSPPHAVRHVVIAQPTFTMYKGRSKIENFTGARLDLLRTVLQKHAGDGGA